MKREKADYTIQAVAHAFDLLEQFHGDTDELGVTELARRLGLHKNNVFRLLATLEARGYIEQNPSNEGYRLGVKVLELGQAFLQQTGLLRHSEPVLHSIVEQVNETAYVAVVRGGEAVYLKAIEPDQTVRVISRVGHRLPLFATAVGKVHAASWPTDQIEEALHHASLNRFTSRTITDVEQLRRELARTIERGYAFDDEEYEEGVRCVATPVYDHTGKVRGSVSTSAPSSRMEEDRVRDEIVPVLKKAAAELSHHLGYEPTPR